LSAAVLRAFAASPSRRSASVAVQRMPLPAGGSAHSQLGAAVAHALQSTTSGACAARPAIERIAFSARRIHSCPILAIHWTTANA
jgi:hypothetical protein